MRKTRFLIVALAALLVLCAFTACNTESDSKDDSNESSSDTSTTPEEESSSTPILPEVDPEIYQYLEFYSNGDGTCSITSIGNYEAEHLVIPAFSPDGDRVTSVGSSDGKCILNYKKVTIPDGVETIRTAFRNCDALEVIYIPKTVKAIEGSFQDSVNIKEVHITDMSAWMNIVFNSDFGNPLYHSDAVLYLKGKPVIDLVIPDNVTSIGDYAFAGYEHLRSITATADSNLTHIGERAFYSCQKLMRAVLSAKLSTIEEEAFNNCRRLVEVVNPSDLDIVRGNSNGYIGYSAIKVETDPAAESRLIFSDDFVFYNDEDNGRILLIACFAETEEIVLPSDFNGEGYYINSFCFIPEVTDRLVIGAGVKGIRDYGLANFSLKEITFESGSQLRHIGSFSFSYCGIESIHLPAETIVIGAGAFENCKNLSSVTFEENSKLKLIGSTAFGNCSKLSEITIPESVMCIGQQAFVGYRINGVAFEDPKGWSRGSSFDAIPEQSLSSSRTAATIIRMGDMLFKGTQEEYMEFIALDELKFN